MILYGHTIELISVTHKATYTDRTLNDFLRLSLLLSEFDYIVYGLTRLYFAGVAEPFAASRSILSFVLTKFRLLSSSGFIWLASQAGSGSSANWSVLRARSACS